MKTGRRSEVIKLFAYKIPFLKPLNFKGFNLKYREGLILQLQDKDGDISLAEIAPLPGFSRETLAQAKEQVIGLLERGLENLSEESELYPSVQFALDYAAQKIPCAPQAVNLDKVPLLQGDNQTVIKQYLALKCPDLVKLKAARQSPEADILLFNQLTSINPLLLIRCDANQAWTVEQADLFFSSINSSRLDYIEEPTASYIDNIQLAEQHQIALALDETLLQPDFCYQYKRCIKALVIKPSLIGSLQRMQALINNAHRDQLKVSISSSFESIVGLQQLTCLALYWQNSTDISLGLDTLKYFAAGPLTTAENLPEALSQLECLWATS
ncbi:o-succinylbenzoate synthase [Psychromonas aquimarina]|uniref:o-succinylbenzoate synthase n=1 Tax=Psychromonas aquimarina TaxID=444919 RepID=UPI000414CAC7|nr:o-succinylbenzoate synthase [Psychromonas aquimarina]